MARSRAVIAILVAVPTIGLSSAWAFVVTDPVTTARNAVTAVLKSRMVETLTEQHRHLRRMARRLSVFTNLDRYLVVDVPRWRVYRFQNIHLYANPYSEALNYGDPDGVAYDSVTRRRSVTGSELTGLLNELPPSARKAVEAELATLDLADSTNITWTNQNGQLRTNSKKQMRTIDALERDVLDPSSTQSATAVLDKISAAVLIEAGQKQSRLQFLTGIVEQLLVENKRARDTEAALLNMQLRRLQAADDEEGGGSLLTGAAHDLRTWRQP